MASIAAKSLLALAVSATVLAPLNTASAGDWRHRNRDAAIIGGVLGLAAGVAVGSALSQPRYEEEPVYAEPPPVRRYQTYQPSYTYDDPDYREYRPAPRPVYRAQPVYEPRPVYRQRQVYRTIEPWSSPGITIARSVTAASIRTAVPISAMMETATSASQADRYSLDF